MKPVRPENCTEAEWQEILASADHANRPRRRVIQIVSFSKENTIDRIAALCDDGTMWRATLPGSGYPIGWEEIDDVPQKPSRFSSPNHVPKQPR